MSGFSIDITGDLNTKLDQLTQQLKDTISDELNNFGSDVVSDAKEFCPVDEGFLKSKITFVKQPLSVEIIVGANYAAYVEFGTRKFAEAYVSTLPPDWQSFAASFRGGGGGSFAEMVQRITDWVHRKGLGSGFAGPIGVAGTYSIKTRMRTGNKQSQASEDKSAAYAIALSILRNGVKAQPFLYPAIDRNLPNLIANLKTI